MAKKKKHIGVAIKRYRTDLGWSLREMASRVGVAHSTIAAIENGESNPSIETLRRISDELQIPISRLFLDIEYSNSEQK